MIRPKRLNVLCKGEKFDKINSKEKRAKRNSLCLILNRLIICFLLIFFDIKKDKHGNYHLIIKHYFLETTLVLKKRSLQVTV